MTRHTLGLLLTFRLLFCAVPTNGWVGTPWRQRRRHAFRQQSSPLRLYYAETNTTTLVSPVLAERVGTALPHNHSGNELEWNDALDTNDMSEDASQDLCRETVHNRAVHMRWNQETSANGQVPTNTDATTSPQRKERAAHFGDIMSTGEGVTTEPEQSLAETYGFHNPLDRMVLTANGNLQRLVSSYYDAAVHVLVDRCQLRQPTADATATTETQSKTWDRVVHLTVLNQTFCTATSVVTVRDPLCVSLVESEKVGLGQLFRYLDLLPEFKLLNASPNADGYGFWREYTLSCAEVSCWIREDFCGGLWNLEPFLPDESSYSTPDTFRII